MTGFLKQKDGADRIHSLANGEKHQIKKLAKGGGGFSLLQHNRFYRHQKQQQTKNNLQNTTSINAFDRSVSLFVAPHYLDQTQVLVSKQKYHSNNDLDLRSQLYDEEQSQMIISSPYTPIDKQKYNSTRPMSAAVGVGSKRQLVSQKQKMNYQPHMMNQDLKSQMSNNSSAQVLNEVRINEQPQQQDASFDVNEKDIQISLAEGIYKVKGTRPKTASKAGYFKKGNYLTNNINMNGAILQTQSQKQKDHSKNLLNKSFRALSKNVFQNGQHFASQQHEVDNCPPQFFTKQLQIDSHSSKKQFNLTSSKILNQRSTSPYPTEYYNSPGRMVAVVIPSTFVQGDELQLDKQNDDQFSQRNNDYFFTQSMIFNQQIQ